MTPAEIWKNFNLGFELDIAGTFIFNGIRAFHELHAFDFRSEIFDFLYNIAVGVERLQKIALILTEHDEARDQEDFERSLITHSHQDLQRRLRNHGHPTLAGLDNALIAILGEFYKTYRYDRYGMGSLGRKGGERELLITWLNEYLDAGLHVGGIFATQHNDRLRKVVGKSIGRIIAPLYQRIEDEAHRLNLYTYELRYDSKAFWVLIGKKYDLIDSDRIRMEMLIYFAASKSCGVNLSLMRHTLPLALEACDEASYIQALLAPQSAFNVEGEIEALYEDQSVVAKERLPLLDALKQVLYSSEQDDSIDEVEDWDDSE